MIFVIRRRKSGSGLAVIGTRASFTGRRVGARAPSASSARAVVGNEGVLRLSVLSCASGFSGEGL